MQDVPEGTYFLRLTSFKPVLPPIFSRLRTPLLWGWRTFGRHVHRFGLLGPKTSTGVWRGARKCMWNVQVITGH